MAELSLDIGLEILGRRALIARTALILFTVMALGMIVVSLGSTGTIDLNSSYADATTVIDFVSVTYMIVYALCSILVAMWIYRAHANLQAAGVGSLEFTPGWAIGWFFVPIASLWEPFQAMRELWRASLLDEEGGRTQATSQLGFWWRHGLAVRSSATSLASAGTRPRPSTLPAWYATSRRHCS